MFQTDGKNVKRRSECLSDVFFNTSARKKESTYYKSSPMKSIRTATDHFLRSPLHSKQMDEKKIQFESICFVFCRCNFPAFEF